MYITFHSLITRHGLGKRHPNLNFIRSPFGLQGPGKKMGIIVP